MEELERVPEEAPSTGTIPSTGDKDAVTEDQRVDFAFPDHSSPSESDHCRICRGEGTDEEPLFYPCKCNGSIRYVHQSCLMQWLTHSQKKHCELCKTAFRFTKLYDPHMPQTVPWPIFVKQATMHVIRLVGRCIRWILVAFVWLAWVPWCMRAVWRALFWFGDGAWVTREQLARGIRTVNTTMNATTGGSVEATPLSEARIPFWQAASRGLNFTTGEPAFLWLGRRLLSTIISPYSTYANTSIEIRWENNTPRSSSLLSGIGFLGKMTKWPILNETLIDILEGQIITVSILATFILIFLIREWVVQQQPMINLGQALEVQAAEQPQQQEQQEDGNEDDDNEEEELESNATGSQDTMAEMDEESLRETAARLEDIFQGATAEQRAEVLETIRTELPAALNAKDTSSDDQFVLLTPPEPDAENAEPRRSRSTQVDSEIGSSLPIRPAMPSRDATTQLSEISRALHEQNLPSSSSPKTDLDSAALARKSSTSSSSILRDGIARERSQIDTASQTIEGRTGHGPETDHQRAASRKRRGSHDGKGSEDINEETARTSREDRTRPDITWSPSDRDSDGDSQTSTDSEDDEEMAANDEVPPDLVAARRLIAARRAGQQPPAVERPLANAVRDPEVVRAAAAAGIDVNEVDQIEDGEDMDGVMELIGVQGPIVGLLQNGMFSTVIISMSVLFGIWIPYLIGKMVLIILANPFIFLIKLPLKWAASAADMVVDVFIFGAGISYYWVDQFVRLGAVPLSWLLPFVKTASLDNTLSKAATGWAWAAAGRLVKNISVSGTYLVDSDIPVFSIVAHESLEKIQNTTSGVFTWMFSGLENVPEDISPYGYIIRQLSRASSGISSGIVQLLTLLKGGMPDSTNFLKLVHLLSSSFDIPRRTKPLQPTAWSASDRTIATVLGYAFLACFGFCYLKLRKYIKDLSAAEKPADAPVVDVLNQAGGVCKVILIIAIEMLAFPLYCGFLLDGALLPLFSNATLASRIAFVQESPWTSTFIHWFVGTCYMFHFALFVSMCRKILRTGVLYFIRDPDDPSFHPVRDVLERNVTTQLKKILFSGLVYGGLVIVCLGAVVWTIPLLVKGIFPIHWSSNEPVLEFPADLLVYNFVMPLAVKVFKPSAGLQDMYNWWFRKCARTLRLSHFLFNERNKDEEGYTVWKKVSPNEELKVAEARNEFKWPVIRDGQFSWQTRSTKHMADPRREDALAAYKKVFVRNGRLVRAPASDAVRIPRGHKTFVDIDPVTHLRKDGLSENPTGLHGRNNKLFANIYIPPWFRMRIASFFVLIWAFAAFTGVSVTVVPLLCGRFIFSRLIQSGPRMNDVYAFAIGFYLIAAPVWIWIRYRSQLAKFTNLVLSKAWLGTDNMTNNLTRLFSFSIQAVRTVYFYGAFGVLLPALLGLVWEAYFLIPLHTYFERTDETIPRHTVHFVSDWTLGVLLVRVAIHVALKYPEERVTKAMVALVVSENSEVSWLKPDIRLATRAFIVPLLAALVCALTVPPALAHLLVTSIFEGIDKQRTTILYRYSYSIFMALICAIALGKAAWRAVNKWRGQVRDEVYLIGERLHNYDDKRVKVSA